MPTLAKQIRLAYKDAIRHVNFAILELQTAQAMTETDEDTKRMNRKAIDDCETYRERLRFLLEDWNRAYPE